MAEVRIASRVADVTDAEAAAAAVDFAVAELGRIDVVVNNAGYANSAPIEEVTQRTFAPKSRRTCSTS
ncbi:MAG: SDR family NAD(P)-dependent oxidoreductase [Mycobacterium sp.]